MTESFLLDVAGGHWWRCSVDVFHGQELDDQTKRSDDDERQEQSYASEIHVSLGKKLPGEDLNSILSNNRSIVRRSSAQLQLFVDAVHSVDTINEKQKDEPEYAFDRDLHCGGLERL